MESDAQLIQPVSEEANALRTRLPPPKLQADTIDRRLALLRIPSLAYFSLFSLSLSRILSSPPSLPCSPPSLLTPAWLVPCSTLPSLVLSSLLFLRWHWRRARPAS